MQQYILSKVNMSIMSVESNVIIRDKVFANERPDKTLKLNHLDIRDCTFANMGFRESEFKECDLSHNIFISCYFKNTNLNQVNFVGSKFINCNFDGVKMQHCDMIYTIFEDCCIDFNLVFNSLPSEYNLREKLCKNLAIECLRAGRDEDYKRFFFQERLAREDHYFETFRLDQKTYYKIKSNNDKIIAFFRYITSKMSRYVWGYGENIYQLFGVMFLVNWIYSIIYWKSGNVFLYTIGNEEKFEIDYYNSFYHSICNFFTVSSGLYTDNNITKIIMMSQYFIGVVFTGFFIASLYKNINRR
ncbi:pentapeptide repeat-containing protein [Desulfosporosinus nitroreducens]|uniref:pentapeptide repeat-containing protein n=1 Tax=Desulfosporosinus nitroreducens TaxID=2018668 RepID=UPI00207D014E|nr:pentapeptide repeat-containing protein [Desulfosporosinus nitroreducens]MCO1600018.1 pentapeptide repeat-containing protein [Desulfosporosinus nitroreducens]